MSTDQLQILIEGSQSCSVLLLGQVAFMMLGNELIEILLGLGVDHIGSEKSMHITCLLLLIQHAAKEGSYSGDGNGAYNCERSVLFKHSWILWLLLKYY